MDKWTEQKANEWYQGQRWLVGSNYLPASAINQLEMWQSDTFNTQEIDQEFGWAHSIGMNTMRIFLHDLLWLQDAKGFQSRIEKLLEISNRHSIKPMFVFFDSCWDPEPTLGTQHPPVPGVHNSGWVQSPGRALADQAEYPRLESYVKQVITAFASDERILAWDLWNEPDNSSTAFYAKSELPNKGALVAQMLPRVFEWARSATPSQPITSGVWLGDWSDSDKLTSVQKTQIEQSDIITFHNYGWPEDFERRVGWLKVHNRPLICTEYMARSLGSIFDLILPVAKRENVGVINWGFVSGKSQTIFPWDSWQTPYTNGPHVWFHDVLHPDGTPYRESEVDLIKRLTGSRH